MVAEALFTSHLLIAETHMVNVGNLHQNLKSLAVDFAHGTAGNLGRMVTTVELHDWLMEGDAAIRWQTQQDLLDRAPSTVARERARVATTGWGKRLLDEQDPEGTWASGIYGRKWVSTTYTLLLLWRMGLPPTNRAARRGCARLWEAVNIDGGVALPTSTTPPDICISAFWLLLAAYYGHDDDRIPDVVEWVLDNQLADGGWNCETIRTGSTHGSFHTTIQVLEALAEMGRHDEAAQRGREFLLDHRLYRSHQTGEVANRAFTMLSFPPRWHYDILRALDHFRFVDAAVDERLHDALEVLGSKQRKDGKWPVQNKHGGIVWFDMVTGRKPSRWNSLRAMRVLRWAQSN